MKTLLGVPGARRLGAVSHFRSLVVSAPAIRYLPLELISLPTPPRAPLNYKRKIKIIGNLKIICSEKITRGENTVIISVGEMREVVSPAGESRGNK